MKRSNYALTLIELLVLLAIMLILAAILAPIFMWHPEGSTRYSCQSNLKQLGLGIAQYVQDYDQRFPRVRGANLATNPNPYSLAYGWADAVYPYVKSNQIMKCPRRGFQGASPNDAVQKGFIDYWFSQRLSGANLVYLDATALTLEMGDGKDAQTSGDARYAIAGLPQDWRTRTDSPAYAHLDGANYCFADGHVKWYKPSIIQNMAPISANKPTFRTGGA